MPARTLEDKRDGELELVRIETKLYDLGKEQPTVERLEYLGRILERATELQRKIEKRGARTPQFDDLIDWSSRTVQTIEIPGERRGVQTTRSSSWASAVRREAKRRGLTAHVRISNGASAHVRLV